MKVKFNQFKTKLTRNSDSKGSNIMKKNRKLTALLVAACMTIPMAATTFTVPMVASAGNNNSITINNATDYNSSAQTNMKAYQVFAGSYNNGTLGVTGWGAGINVSLFIEKLQTDSIFENAFNGINRESNTTTAQAVADVIAKLGNTTKEEAVARYAVLAKTTAAATSTASGNNAVISGLDDGYYVIVDESSGTGEALTLGLLQVAGGENASVNTKRVAPTVTKTATDSTTNYYDDVIDCYMGETVHFKVEVDVHDISKYTNYYLEIIDELGTDFTLNVDSISVMHNGSDIKSACTIDTTTNNKIVVQIFNAKTYTNGKIYLEYDATLNSSATTGENAFNDETQVNKAEVKYLKDPNKSWTSGTKPTDDELSTTAESLVKVLTYELDIKKFDSNNQELGLQNAEFRLKFPNGKGVQLNDNGNGTYTVSGSVDGDGTLFKTDSYGNVKIIGLDAGEYTLTEITAPEGYNILTEDAKVHILPTIGDISNPLNGFSGDVVYKGAKTDGTATETDGVVKIGVANSQGATLPSTGGIGTKIFYVLGGTLVIGSGAALVIKKRMGKDEE